MLILDVFSRSQAVQYWLKEYLNNSIVMIELL